MSDKKASLFDDEEEEGKRRNSKPFLEYTATQEPETQQ